MIRSVFKWNKKKPAVLKLAPFSGILDDSINQGPGDEVDHSATL